MRSLDVGEPQRPGPDACPIGSRLVRLQKTKFRRGLDKATIGRRPVRAMTLLTFVSVASRDQIWVIRSYFGACVMKRTHRIRATVAAYAEGSPASPRTGSPGIGSISVSLSFLTLLTSRLTA